jgi:hypothetical protein
VVFRFCLLVAWGLALGCLNPVVEPVPAVYHNPLDILDGGIPPIPDSGTPPSDGGLPPGPDATVGTVDARTPQFTSAIYQVTTQGGPARTLIFVADVSDLCALAQDGGLGTNWNQLRMHLAGDTPASYVVQPILPPAGAIAEFDFQDQSGAYGLTAAASGEIQLDAVDPGNAQTTTGTYTLGFGDSGSLTGRFTAEPCSAVPPQAGY